MLHTKQNGKINLKFTFFIESCCINQIQGSNNFVDSTQGPLLGMLITGPLGFILGLFGGAIVWLFKTKNK